MNSYRTPVFVVLCLLWASSSYGQTSVWSCVTNCSATSNTYNDGAWRSPTPIPAYVAATNGTNVATVGSDGRMVCRNWWNTSGAIRWRTVASLQSNHCVSIRIGTVESFATVAALWPVEPPPPPPPPTPGPEIDAPVFSRADGKPWTNYVYTNEEVIISWTSRYADSCTGSWSQQPIPTSGTARLSYALPMANAWQSINCVNAYGAYGTTSGFRVLSRAPDCYAKTPDDRDKVNVKALSLANVSLRYQIMAAWWCASPSGPVQQRYVLGVQDQETIAAFRKWLDRQFDESGVRARCEQNCEVLPDGALKQELDQWAALPENSAAVLGVIQP